MATIFSKIISGEIPSYKIAESEQFFAFLDIRPLSKGHTLVVPKEEVDYLFDLEENQLTGIMSFSRRVARAIESVVPCERIGMAVVGFEVPHAHIHLVPINQLEDLDFKKEPLSFPEEEMDSLAASIRAAFP